MIPDLTVRADVILESDEDEVTMVPVNAVETDEESGQHCVYVKAGEGWERRVVDLGLRNNISVAVRSGIKPGEEVALEIPGGRSGAP